MPTDSQAFVSEWKGKLLDGNIAEMALMLADADVAFIRNCRASSGRLDCSNSTTHAGR